MDEYEKKLKELRTYVPFLTKMIDKLEKAGDKSKEAQVKLITCFHDSWIYEFLFVLFFCMVEFFYWDQNCRSSYLIITKKNNTLQSLEKWIIEFCENKPERIFGLQVRCRELDIFKLLGNFLHFLEKFWESLRRIILEDFFGRILWEDFLRGFLGGFF